MSVLSLYYKKQANYFAIFFIGNVFNLQQTSTVWRKCGSKYHTKFFIKIIFRNHLIDVLCVAAHKVSCKKSLINT